MIVVFQILVIFFVGLIAYWWANQGLFSSLLHFVAVVCAGGIALAFWEVLVVNVLLKNYGTDNYAWALSLVALFVVSLFIIRYAFDKLAPANVAIPHWANLLFGGIFGIGSGVITIGILMIAIGFTQSTNELLGFRGDGRSNTGIETVDTAWVPAHSWTVGFYEFLSGGALYPEFTGKPLKKVNPELDEQAFSLIRDTYKNGAARISLVPDSVEVGKVRQSPSRVYVPVTVKVESFDHSDVFILSASQVRLLAYENGSVRKGDVSVAFPDYWSQLVKDGTNFPERRFRFDDVSHYVTSIPGRTDVTFELEFPKGGGDGQISPTAIPRFVQIKGVRYELGTIEAGGGAGSAIASGTAIKPTNPNAPDAGEDDIQQREDIKPINSASLNTTIGFEKDGFYLVEGQQTFKRGGRAPNRETRIKGIYTPSGSQIVRVNVSRGRPTSLYSPAREVAGEDAAPVLVDTNGNRYYAIGSLISTPDNATLKLHPDSLIRSLGELPHLPTSGANELWLFYRVTEGVQLTSFRFDEETVAKCNITVEVR